MSNRRMTGRHLEQFKEYLQKEEKSQVTIEKYMRDNYNFMIFLQERKLSKEETIAYKKLLEERGYAVSSINSMVASMNSFFDFMGWMEFKVKHIRCQRQIYCSENKELSKEEYYRLLEATKNDTQLNLILQTICSTGIRVSELKFFTVEAIEKGEIAVWCKNKIRVIMIPEKLRQLLWNYVSENKIRTGVIFVTKKGNPIDRSNLWSQMKRICEIANVDSSKVFPHNLRKLFARTFYHIEKDIAKLADILGHNNIETTRIYIMATGVEHRKKIEQLGLIV